MIIPGFGMEARPIEALFPKTWCDLNFQAETVPNKPCHPNPTALVGNWLTGRGNVVELVKVR